MSCTVVAREDEKYLHIVIHSRICLLVKSRHYSNSLETLNFPCSVLTSLPIAYKLELYNITSSLTMWHQTVSF